MRKLVSIQKVWNIKPIPDADNIECISILGWEVVSKKNEFKVGDLAVYFEIDSGLPLTDSRFDFIANRKIKDPVTGVETMVKSGKVIDGKQYSILKSVRLKKQLSQGLALPLSMFPEIKNPVEDMEVTELLNVVKYEFIDDGEKESEQVPKDTSITVKVLRFLNKIPQPMVTHYMINLLLSKCKTKNKISGNFPNHTPKSDETRIQNMYGAIMNRPDVKDLTVEVTLKMDGSSMTAFLKDGEFGICSRNIRKNHKDNIVKIKRIKWLPEWMQKCEIKTITVCEDNFTIMAKKYQIEKKLRKLNRNLSIQGELVGPSIQANFECLKEIDLFIFNIYDIDKKQYLDPKERKIVLDQLNDGEDIKLKHVPVIIDEIKLFSEYPTLEALLSLASGKGYFGAKFREGLVINGISDPSFGCKIVSNEYLLAKK